MAQDPSPPDRPAAGPAAADVRAGGGAAAQAAARALTADEARVAAARRLHPAVSAGGGTLPGLDRLAGLGARLLGAGSGRIVLLSDAQALVGAAGPQPGGGRSGAGGREDPLAQWLCTQTAASGAPLAITDTAADARVADLAPVASGAVGSYLGAPLVVDGGHVVGAVCVFDPTARTWSEQDVALLQQVADAAATELELGALSGEHLSNRALLELTVDAAELGTFDLDLASGALSVNDRLLHLSGLSRESFSGAPEDVYARIHPDDREATVAAVRASTSTGGDYRAEYRVVLPGGHRWLAARGTTLPGPDGTPARLLGAVHDITGVRAAGERVEHILDSMAVAYLAVDERWRIVYVNAEGERIAAASRRQLLGRDFWEAFPATVGTVFEERYRHAVATGETVVFDAPHPAPLDVWVEVRAVPGNGGLALYFLDITARRSAQRAAEDARRAVEGANARLELLAAVSRQMSEALEAEEAVAGLAQLLVPALGDWCVITLVEDDAIATTPVSARDARRALLRRGLRDVGWWHHREELRAVVRDYAEHRLGELTDESFLWQALRQPAPLTVPEDAARAITAVLAPGGRARDLLAQLSPGSATVFPLRGRGRTVGVLTVFASAERGPLDEQEMATATEVADRAGLALDSARLYRQQRELAEGLQRSLLSEPPEPDHGQVVVRYLPAAEAAQVGGDWYDAFVQPAGATVLVIGDVVGHDTQAAAAMSQVRTMLRTVGALGNDAPAQVLAATDRAMANLEVPTTATAIVARLEQTPEERRRGTTRLRWSNAGHPPAMVIHPDGTVLPLIGAHADLLLGVLPDVEREDFEVLLDRGCTVVLYTDGLVERRDQPLAEGLEALRDVLEDLAGQHTDLDTLVDRLLHEMLPPRPEDDVAVIAVRLHRQDRPRPAEAGPRRVPAHVPAEPEPGA